VTNAAGKSSPFNITVNSVQPGLLAPSSFSVNGIQYAAAFFADGTYVLPTGAIPGTLPGRNRDKPHRHKYKTRFLLMMPAWQHG
jgi:hypothetical protein